MSNFILHGTKMPYHLDALRKWSCGESIYPILIEISPTNTCNHACRFCAYEYLERKVPIFIDTDMLYKRIKEIQPYGTKALFYSGEGEPLLHKKLPEFIESIANLGMDQALNTNGVLLNGKRMERLLPHMEWIRVSLNGTSSEEYAHIHRSGQYDFDIVLKNLKEAVAYKHANNLSTTLGVQMVYAGQNPQHIYSLVKHMREIGVSYFALKNYNNHPLNTFQVTDLPKDDLACIQELATDDFAVVLRINMLAPPQKRQYSFCHALPFFAEIISNGDVYSCGPHLGNADFCYGNINSTTLVKLWASENRHKVENHIRGIADLDQTCMPNCRLHELNMFLWGLANPPQHINFI